jgi:serine/threonine protein kinase
MAGEIIAEKFALIKTQGSNGVAFTYVVEDTYRDERAVIKISDKLGPLTLEYLKVINLLRELELPGILLPYEGGILEEESGYYFAYPEVGQPSLENFLRIGIPLECEEAVRIINGVLDTLEGLHNSGFFHLFINTRNIFYQPRGLILLKDPALSKDFFHPLLEVVASPDFSYFSPEVMDGKSLGVEADLYAVSRLAQRLLEEVADAGTSPSAVVIASLADKCIGREIVEEGLSASAMKALLAKAEGKENKASRKIAVDGGDESSDRKSSQAKRKTRKKSPIRDRERKMGLLSRALLVLLFLPLIFLGLLVVLSMKGGTEQDLPKTAAALAAEDKDPMTNTEPEPGLIDEHIGDHQEPEGPVEVSTTSREEHASSVESNDGVSDIEMPEDSTQDVEPAEPSPMPPVASFSMSPKEGQSPLQVYLDASSSYDPDGSIISYVWSFGGQGQALYHVFESNVIPSSLSVTLTVTDDGGHCSSTTRYVTVY